MSTEAWWIVIGFLGQAFFSGRFLVQWLASERARRSAIGLRPEPGNDLVRDLGPDLGNDLGRPSA